MNAYGYRLKVRFLERCYLLIDFDHGDKVEEHFAKGQTLLFETCRVMLMPVTYSIGLFA